MRSLEPVFKPESVALVGASRRPNSIGAVLARNLLDGGFPGAILPVNLHAESVAGVLAYPDVASLPLTPDLAIIATPPETVPGLVDELGRRGTRAVVIITAGFGEGGRTHGKALADELRAAARTHALAIVGPNTVGVLAPNHGLNASFAHLAPPPGKLAFVTQSGAIVTSVIDWAMPRRIGFSHLVSLGGMLDVDFGDMLDYLANDPQTEAILLHIEGVRHARKFLRAARSAVTRKPVLVVKSGRHPASAQAAASHTGALAGSDAVYEAALRRAGLLRVDSLEELFAAVETLSDVPPPRGRRLGILSNGGGIGVIAADELLRRGGTLPDLSPETIASLDEVLPPTWSRRNPIDIIGDAPPERTRDAVRALLADTSEFDALLVLNCPTAVATPEDCARALVEGVRESGAKLPLLTSWVGEATAGQGRKVLNDAGIATYDTPGQAVDAFMQLVEHRERRALMIETPMPASDRRAPDPEAARRLVEERLATEEQAWLSEPEAKSVLAAYGIPVVPTHIALTPEEAGRLAAELDAPLVVKIVSPDILHKSDVSGVALNLESPEAVVTSAQRMEQELGRKAPDARLTGFSVQPMMRRPAAYELIVGAHTDDPFGPVLLFGQGGTAVELIDDTSLELPPLNDHLAHELMARTRIHRLLLGYRNRRPVDLDAIADALVRVSELVLDLPEVTSLDINPLLANHEGVVALDARIRIERRPGGPGALDLP
jgi:acetyltransferase